MDTLGRFLLQKMNMEPAEVPIWVFQTEHKT